MAMVIPRLISVRLWPIAIDLDAHQYRMRVNTTFFPVPHGQELQRSLRIQMIPRPVFDVRSLRVASVGSEWATGGFYSRIAEIDMQLNPPNDLFPVNTTSEIFGRMIVWVDKARFCSDPLRLGAGWSSTGDGMPLDTIEDCAPMDNCLSSTSLT